MSKLGLDALVQLDIRIQEILFRGLRVELQAAGIGGDLPTQDFRKAFPGRRLLASVFEFHFPKAVLTPFLFVSSLMPNASQHFARPSNQTPTSPLRLHPSEFSARITTNSAARRARFVEARCFGLWRRSHGQRRLIRRR